MDSFFQLSISQHPHLIRKVLFVDGLHPYVVVNPLLRPHLINMHVQALLNAESYLFQYMHVLKCLFLARLTFFGPGQGRVDSVNRQHKSINLEFGLLFYLFDATQI